MAQWLTEEATEYLPNGDRFRFWDDHTNYTRTYFVDGRNAEGGDGSEENPFRTIGMAAQVLQPGEKVRIHAGVYREWVNPKTGGTDEEHMIAYEAYGDGEVDIRASEAVTQFEPSTDWRMWIRPGETAPDGMRVYAYHLDPDLFRGYNPFCCVNILHDRLYIEYAKTDMTTYLNRRGMVFCDGKPLQQVPLYGGMAAQDGTYWVEANGQTVHFRLPGDEDPQNHLIEVTVREQCLAPEASFLSYIRVSGLTASHAATGAPVPQRGAISAHRGHHWIIEDCKVNWSNCVGIDIGNECWHHNFEKNQRIGYSILRRNTILDCGVCGIAGLFAEEMLVEDNLVEGTGWQKMELSWEAGGIKLHNSHNGLFRRNIFRRTYRADHLWFDCGNENNRITENLFLDGMEQREAIFIECTKNGINLIDHNLIWNVEGRFDPALIPEEPGSSGWYKTRERDDVNGYGIYGEGTDHLRIAFNLIGTCRGSGFYEKPVSFRMGGSERGGTSRDSVLVSNLFYKCQEAAITFPTEHNTSEGNLIVKESGGYLRIMYPEPELCLHLPAWQEFTGKDQQGQEGWFDVEVDTKALTLRMVPSAEKPMFFPGSEREMAESMEEVQGLTGEALLTALDRIAPDTAGVVEGSEDMIFMPGFIGDIRMGEVYEIDPRK